MFRRASENTFEILSIQSTGSLLQTPGRGTVCLFPWLFDLWWPSMLLMMCVLTHESRKIREGKVNSREFVTTDPQLFSAPSFPSTSAGPFCENYLGYDLSDLGEDIYVQMPTTSFLYQIRSSNPQSKPSVVMSWLPLPKSLDQQASFRRKRESSFHVPGTHPCLMTLFSLTSVWWSWGCSIRVYSGTPPVPHAIELPVLRVGAWLPADVGFGSQLELFLSASFILRYASPSCAKVPRFGAARRRC